MQWLNNVNLFIFNYQIILRLPDGTIETKLVDGVLWGDG